MKISVIIPVYNVEDYISQCINSLIHQSYKNFEAIIVNDGSQDNSIKLAKKIVGADPRFIFFDKENGGQSSARNLGLDYASGDYIAFLDADDSFTLDCFDKAITFFKKNRIIDIVLFGYSLIDNKGEVVDQYMPSIDNYEKKQDILLLNSTINAGVTNKIYKADIWKSSRFIEGIIYEDKEIMPKILHKKKLGLIKKHLYCYNQRNSSTMNSYNALSLPSMLRVHEQFRSFLLENNLQNKFQECLTKSYIKSCFFENNILILKFSKNFKKDLAYAMTQLDQDICSFKNTAKLFGIFSKFSLFFIMLKISPTLTKFLYLHLRK